MKAIAYTAMLAFFALWIFAACGIDHLVCSWLMCMCALAMVVMSTCKRQDTRTVYTILRSFEKR